MDEEGGEEEMEWLMEELEAPPTASAGIQRGRSEQSNGHITTKPVNTDGLRSFSLDEDSEDEVLSVPGVQVVKSSSAHRGNSGMQRSALLQVSTSRPETSPHYVSICRSTLFWATLNHARRRHKAL